MDRVLERFSSALSSHGKQIDNDIMLKRVMERGEQGELDLCQLSSLSAALNRVVWYKLQQAACGMRHVANGKWRHSKVLRRPRQVAQVAGGLKCP
ncbi:hypothetical protein ACLKA7_014809 [Drosophila subpalustris]